MSVIPPVPNTHGYVFLVARDISSGNVYPIAGQFDANGNFVLLTSGSGGTTTPPATPVTGNPIGPYLWLTYA